MSLLPLKIVAEIIRGRELLEVLDDFFCSGARIIRGGTLLEVIRYVKEIEACT